MIKIPGRKVMTSHADATANCCVNGVRAHCDRKALESNTVMPMNTTAVTTLRGSKTDSMTSMLKEETECKRARLIFI